MGILDYSQQNPWVGDALQTVAQGLLAYGTGNPQALAALPMMLQQRQQLRKDDRRQAKMDQRQEQIWQLQMEEADRNRNKDAAQKQAALGLVGTQAPNGMSQAQFGGAPTDGGLLGGFDPQVQNYIKTLVDSGDYGSAIDIYGKLATEKPEPTKWITEKVREGDRDVTYLINPITLERQKLGEGAAFAPQQPREDPLVEVYDPITKTNIWKPRSQAAGLPSEGPTTPSGKDVLDATKDINAMVKPYIDSASNMKKQVEQINVALGQQNGPGDIAAIIAFNKLLDEGAVVRESDVALTLSAQSVLDQMKAWQVNAREGEIMPQALRDKLKATTQAFYDAGSKYSKARIEGFRGLAEPVGVNWGNIVSPGLESMLWGSAPVAPGQTADDIMNQFGGSSLGGPR